MKIVHMKDLRCLELEKQITLQETQINNLKRDKINMIKDKEKEVSDVKETCTQMQAEIDKLNKKIA